MKDIILTFATGFFFLVAMFSLALCLGVIVYKCLNVITAIALLATIYYVGKGQRKK